MGKKMWVKVLKMDNKIMPNWQCQDSSLYCYLNIFAKVVYNSFRILFLTILLCGSLLHWHWKGSLISYLSLVVPFKPFSSLEELLSSPYDITLLGNSAVQEHFEDAKPGIFQSLWLNKFSDRTKSLTKFPKDSTKLALNFKYAQYTDYQVAINLKEYEDCKIQIMDVQGKKALTSFAFPRNSPYIELFNSKIQKMIENGELEKMKEKYLFSKKNPNCQKHGGKSIGFENILIIFILLSFGIISSLVFCCAELIFKRFIEF